MVSLCSLVNVRFDGDRNRVGSAATAAVVVGFLLAIVTIEYALRLRLVLHRDDLNRITIELTYGFCYVIATG
jgi:hypothetical protein